VAKAAGVTVEEMLGRKAGDLLSDPDEAEHLLADDLKAFDGTGEWRTGEAVYLGPTGEERIYSTVKLPIPPVDGQDDMLLGVATDITEHKRAEEQIRSLNVGLDRRVKERTRELWAANKQLERARAEADEANRAKSDFLATMSHEIRTPMNGVLGMLDVLSHSRLDESQVSSIETIRESGLTLLRLIDDILDFSKIDAGHLELERIPVSVTEIVEGVRDSLVALASKKGIDLLLFIDPRVSAEIWSDPTRIRQVLINLIGNAIKFSGNQAHHRGSIEVRVERDDDETPRLKLTVADNGIGKDRLFTAFSQGEDSTTRRYGGTGLGLAICQRLVDLMQGEIAVESTLGHGSTFTVTLPLESVASRERHDLSGEPERVVRVGSGSPVAHRSGKVSTGATPHTVAEARARGQLVLVAEDDSISQTVMLRQLGLLGYTGEVAANGAQALRLWRQGGYALLLTDLHMPEIDGYELTELIRKEEKGLRRIPILAVTANALPGEAKRARAAGMDGYLTKPIQLDTLRDALEKWVLPWGKPVAPVETMAATGSNGAEPGKPAMDVEELKCFVGSDEIVVHKFLADYLSTVGSQCEELHTVFAESGTSGIVSIAHSLKSSARLVGASGFFSSCAELEGACKTGDKQATGQLILRVEEEFAAVEAEISGLLGRQEVSRAGRGSC
jgi:PAS domain S-box-containing protein